MRTTSGAVTDALRSLRRGFGAGLACTLAHGLLSPGIAFSAASDSAFMACASEQDDARRLACFDAAVVRARSQPAPVVAATTTATAAKPAAVAAAPVLTKEEKFGLRGDLKQEKVKQAPELAELESLSGKVTKVAAKPYGQLIVTLDNGQTWTEIQAYSGLRVKVGDQVTVKAGALGSYSLVANGRSSKVTRVR
jgi:hypothetical protein